MPKPSEGLVRIWVDKFRAIATKVEVAVHMKQPADEGYHQEIKDTVAGLVAQAEALRDGTNRDELIRHVRGKLKVQAETLVTPNSLTPQAHSQPSTIKRAEIFREVVDLLTKQIPDGK